jgi:hypothetical protein
MDTCERLLPLLALRFHCRRVARVQYRILTPAHDPTPTAEGYPPPDFTRGQLNGRVGPGPLRLVAADATRGR